MLSKQRDLATTHRFFNHAIWSNGIPKRIVIDKSGANFEGVLAVTTVLKLPSQGEVIEICPRKYLNTIVEQDHLFIKRITKPMMGFKAFHSAAATLAGIETAHMIRKTSSQPPKSQHLPSSQVWLRNLFNNGRSQTRVLTLYHVLFSQLMWQDAYVTAAIHSGRIRLKIFADGGE